MFGRPFPECQGGYAANNHSHGGGLRYSHDSHIVQQLPMRIDLISEGDDGRIRCCRPLKLVKLPNGGARIAESAKSLVPPRDNYRSIAWGTFADSPMPGQKARGILFVAVEALKTPSASAINIPTVLCQSERGIALASERADDWAAVASWEQAIVGKKSPVRQAQIPFMSLHTISVHPTLS